MRYLVLLLLVLPVLAQTAEQPGTQYSSYTLLLVPQQGEGFMIAIDKQQKIVFVPITSVSKAVKEDGHSATRTDTKPRADAFPFVARDGLFWRIAPRLFHARTLPVTSLQVLTGLHWSHVRRIASRCN